ncbi:membrane protein insertase YidC [Candidatus Saccharibacteria bacterium]|nr:membrane protein insertase YidC [Candidatus Saccharibacteria bacterium]
MFDTFIVQPIFNLLVLIYNIVPGHNFGLAIIIFTIVVRLLMWPLVKKQLHHTKAIRLLMPELRKIKLAAKGDRRKESQLTMELYKEREINPLATIGIALVQAPILIGLYFGLQKIIKDPNQLINFSYSFLHFGWLDTLAHNIHQFDNTLFGMVDLSRTASGPKGTYWPAVIIVAASALVQYIQSKQLMPTAKDSRGLRSILKEAGQGKQADQQEVSAAVGRGTLIFIPFIVLVVGLNFAVALPLYWLTSSFVALIQQSKVLREDVSEAETVMSSSPVVDADRLGSKASPRKKTAKRGHHKRKRR